ncbi:MAG TPA: hypothetical protein VHJ16_15390 [Xanthobacteraceae bacterium]|nr:hypothetical protein [Xanthobacteraceae bacterium]
MLARQWPIYVALACKWCGITIASMRRYRMDAAVNDDTLPKLAGDFALVSVTIGGATSAAPECSAWQERFEDASWRGRIDQCAQFSGTCHDAGQRADDLRDAVESLRIFATAAPLGLTGAAS